MDTIALVEAAYRMGNATQDWLSGIVAEAKHVFAADGGDGSAGIVIDAARTTATSPHLLGIAVDGIPGDAHAAFADMIGLGIRPATMMQIRRAGPVSTLSAALGPSFTQVGGFREHLHKHALGDAAHVVAGDPFGLSCVLATAFRRAHAFSAQSGATWQLLATHVAAGLRLRHRTSDTACSAPGVEAIMEMDGKLQYAAGCARAREARERLRGAARDIVRARGSMRRRDPMAALQLWQGLVAGRWSIVDRLESDGRRFLVACCNEPESRTQHEMSRREAQVATLVGLGHANKVVAYELGISISCVATYLRRARHKLGLKSRTELIELFLRSVP
jgi:DNA-binding CsgD family transcriptional regulator